MPEDKLNVSTHYLPHHHGIKIMSTSKIRPVFDASVKQKISSNLNDGLYIGINLTELIETVLDWKE